MATIRAVGDDYPLRRQLRIARVSSAPGGEPSGAPPAGEVYADPRLIEALGLKLDDTLAFGVGALRVTGVLRAEPDASDELLQLSPPLMANRSDVDAAGLLGPGSRASYRLMFAGAPSAIAELRDWLKSRSAGYRLISIGDTPRGLRAAFDRAGRFLSLPALLAVLLAGVSTALAANRFARHGGGAALSGCPPG